MHSPDERINFPRYPPLLRTQKSCYSFSGIVIFPPKIHNPFFSFPGDYIPRFFGSPGRRHGSPDSSPLEEEAFDRAAAGCFILDPGFWRFVFPISAGPLPAANPPVLSRIAPASCPPKRVGRESHLVLPVNMSRTERLSPPSDIPMPDGQFPMPMRDRLLRAARHPESLVQMNQRAAAVFVSCTNLLECFYCDPRLQMFFPHGRLLIPPCPPPIPLLRLLN